MEPTLLKFPPGWQNQMGGCGMSKLGEDIERWLFPVSKLCGLPAHLPRHLASFSPSVDDRDGGGSGSRGLGHRGGLLSDRGGGFRVLIVHCNCGGQRCYRRTVLQGRRVAVHRLALGWSAALRVGVGVVDAAAAEAGAQLQAPHVADHSRRIKGLPPFAFGKVFPHLSTD